MRSLLILEIGVLFFQFHFIPPMKIFSNIQNNYFLSDVNICSGREYIELITGSIKRIADFLNSFDM